MRRLTDDLVLSLKDQIRTLRYSLRSEADAPGSSLPDAYRKVDFGPIGAVGAMIGTPMIRMADGLFTQVEHVTLGLMEGESVPAIFPRSITDYFAFGDTRSPFTHDFYGETKALLSRHGARHVLVSEHAIEDLRNEIVLRHRDLIGSASSRPAAGAEVTGSAATVLCAAVAVGFARSRPILKLDLSRSAHQPRHLLIAPNAYCGLVLGLAVAIATVKIDARALEGRELVESADAVVDARFERLKIAIDKKDAVSALAREFETLLPFLP